ncbi:hypothetical protein JNK13_08355 [bacterium]|nr:hypothetical protein [bacterium]
MRKLRTLSYSLPLYIIGLFGVVVAYAQEKNFVPLENPRTTSNQELATGGTIVATPGQAPEVPIQTDRGLHSAANFQKSISLNGINFPCPSGCDLHDGLTCSIFLNGQVEKKSCEDLFDYLLESTAGSEISLSQLRIYALSSQISDTRAKLILTKLLQSESESQNLANSMKLIVEKFERPLSEVINGLEPPPSRTVLRALWNQVSSGRSEYQKILRRLVLQRDTDNREVDLLSLLDATNPLQVTAEVKSLCTDQRFRNNPVCSFGFKILNFITRCEPLLTADKFPLECSEIEIQKFPEFSRKFLRGIQLEFLLKRVMTDDLSATKAIQLIANSSYLVFPIGRVSSVLRDKIAQAKNASDLNIFKLTRNVKHALTRISSLYPEDVALLYAAMAKAASNKNDPGGVERYLNESYLIYPLEIAERNTLLKSVALPDANKPAIDKFFDLLAEFYWVPLLIALVLFLVIHIIVRKHKEKRHRKQRPHSLVHGESSELHNLLKKFALPEDATELQLWERFKILAKQIQSDATHPGSTVESFHKLTTDLHRAIDLIKKKADPHGN